jgi:hypothetical protein
MTLGPLKKKTLHTESLYDTDFHRWAKEQGEALREQRFANIDWRNVAEEIESLGRSDKRSIESNLAVILLHLLKWHHQPQKRKAGWKSSIAEHRARIGKLLSESPSLRGYPAEVLAEEYALARTKASDETRIAEDVFSELCPFTIDQVLDSAFYPGEGE